MASAHGFRPFVLNGCTQDQFLRDMARAGFALIHDTLRHAPLLAFTHLNHGTRVFTVNARETFSTARDRLIKEAQI